MKKYLCFIPIFVFLASCTKTLDFNDTAFANQVIVNSIIWPDETFAVYLTQSSSILKDDPNNPPMKGSMDLYEDGTMVRQFPLLTGKFSATDIKPRGGKKYLIVITSNGQQINAETTIPNQAEVMGIDTATNKNANGSRTTNYSIKLKDSPGEDYYRIVVMNETLVQRKDPEGVEKMKYYLNKSQNLIYSVDTVFKTVYKNFDGAIHTQGPVNDYFIFPDTYFQGEIYTIQINSTTSFNGITDFNGYGEPVNPLLRIKNKRIYERNVVHVQRLSKELYTYLKYLKLYNNFYDVPFSEPITVYSNIKNGAGIFAGFNDDARFTFEKSYIPYLMDTIHVEENPSYGNQ
jgi:hypothetical protein